MHSLLNKWPHSREAYRIVMQEKQPKWVTFQSTYNDLSLPSSLLLIDFKVIIAKALPNMDKPHIIRLLFDPRHESLMIYENHRMIGGVCYRVFPEAGFAEIAFLAITHDRRIQGFGQKVMNRLKKQMQWRKVEFLLTYGDNMALGFFRKQGFSEKLTLPKRRWEGYIKEYDGGKLMECKIYPKVDYLQINSIIQKQKKFLIQQIRSLSINSVTFSSKDIPEARTLVRATPDADLEVFRTDPRFIPGVLAGGWTFQEHDALLKSSQEPLEKRCRNIVDKIRKYPESLPFRRPISAKDAPEYHEHIKTPMDLLTIDDKIEKGQYREEHGFCSDVELIISNCKEFNHPHTIYYRNAVDLQKLITPILSAFKNGIIRTA